MNSPCHRETLTRSWWRHVEPRVWAVCLCVSCALVPCLVLNSEVLLLNPAAPSFCTICPHEWPVLSRNFDKKLVETRVEPRVWAICLSLRSFSSCCFPPATRLRAVGFEWEQFSNLLSKKMICFCFWRNLPCQYKNTFNAGILIFVLYWQMQIFDWLAGTKCLASQVQNVLPVCLKFGSVPAQKCTDCRYIIFSFCTSKLFA